MSDRSSIEWTDASWNPVTGCTKVSPGCSNCYAERIAERLRGTRAFPFGFDVILHPDRLDKPKSWRRPRRIFVNSMSDLFHEQIPFDFVDQVYSSMCQANHHVYQVLTKRPERMLQWSNSRGVEFPQHIWVGVSVESQYWTKRIPLLQKVPAAIRFLSCEPLLKPLSLRNSFDTGDIHWVIVGGESGPRARPMKEEWVKNVRDECQIADVPFFFKQWGGKTSKSGGRVLDGIIWSEFPRTLAIETRLSNGRDKLVSNELPSSTNMAIIR